MKEATNRKVNLRGRKESISKDGDLHHPLMFCLLGEAEVVQPALQAMFPGSPISVYPDFQSCQNSYLVAGTIVVLYGCTDPRVLNSIRASSRGIICLLKEEDAQWGMSQLVQELIDDFILVDDFKKVNFQKAIVKIKRHTEREMLSPAPYQSLMFALNHIPALAFYVDANKQVVLNKVAKKLLAFDKDEWTAHPADTLFYDEFLGYLNGENERVRWLKIKGSDGKTLRGTLKSGYELGNGASLWIVDAGVDTQHGFIRYDDLMEEHRKFRLAAKTSKLGVWHVDFYNDSVVLDEGASSIYGLPKGYEGLNRIRWRLFLHPEDEFAVLKAFEAINEGKDTLDIEYRIVSIDLQVKYVRVSAEVKRNELGERIGLIGLVLDISDYVLRGKSIQRQNDRLREIAWTQSHVVRAPLARIMGLVEVMDNLDGPDRDTAFKGILTSARELDEIVRQLVNSSEKIISFNEFLKE